MLGLTQMLSMLGIDPQKLDQLIADAQGYLKKYDQRLDNLEKMVAELAAKKEGGDNDN